MNFVVFATSPGDTITDWVNEVAKSLRYPVLILALIAGAFVIYEIGRLLVEAWKRSQRPKTPFDQTARHALAQARSGDSAGAQATLRAYSYGDALQKAAVGTLFATNAIDAQRAVIDYDLYISKRLDRVRLLVRAGPALGLMGTLIPLAPALSALGKGQPTVLADELQSAFAITVVGVAVGLIAFTVALIRERYYTKDLADLEFLREIRGDAQILVPATAAQPSAASSAQQTATAQPTAAITEISNAPIDAPVPPPAVVPAPAAAPAPAQPAYVPPAGAALPPLPTEPKKKFGIKKKSKKSPTDAVAFPPPPPAAAVPGAPAAPTPVQPGTGIPATSDPVSLGTDKTPSIPDAPAADDAKSSLPDAPSSDVSDDDGDKA